MICGLLLCLCLMPFAASGAEVKGLYEAEMFVPDQTRSQRRLAMSAALAEVVAKVSGHREARLKPGVTQAIRQPARYLQQYRYRALTETQRREADAGEDLQRIFFRFDKRAVDKLLSDNGLSVWGATRPAVLAWVAVEDEGRRYLLGSDGPDPLRRLVDEEAHRRGLVLVLPLLDLEDQARLQIADIWGEFREVVEQASARYRPEAVLVGRLYRAPMGEWRSDWQIMQGVEAERWRADGVLQAEVVEEGVSGAVEWLAARYAPLAGGAEEGLLPLTVTAVRGLVDYARVTRYLQSLQQVSRLRTTQVEADRVSFELEIQGRAAGIVQTIALGNVLRPFAGAAEGAAGPDPLSSPAVTGMRVYRLQP